LKIVVYMLNMISFKVVLKIPFYEIDESQV
jgi:hypothetical protein